MSKPDICILVAMHKDAYWAPAEIIKPIAVGGYKPKSNSIKYRLFYDNSGNNISHKNESYSELTAIYWAWKNLDADYIGLFHYRRYFSFSNHIKNKASSTVPFPTIKSAEKKLKIKTKHAIDLIRRHDILLPLEEDSRKHGFNSMYDFYASEHNIEDLDHCIQYINKSYPGVSKFVGTLHEPNGYAYNMFIMKNELFNDYCKFIFDVLEDFDKNHDISDYDSYQKRVDGFLAERLSSVYFKYLESLKKYRIANLQTAYFEDTRPMQNYALIRRWSRDAMMVLVRLVRLGDN